MSQKTNLSRRRFFRNSFLGSSSMLFFPGVFRVGRFNDHYEPFTESHAQKVPTAPLDLNPARWIWFSSKRTLPNSVVLFRREINIDSGLIRAAGWIFADSRYRLFLNGQRIQWGPAPCDPRYQEVDPLDFTDRLVPGKNIIGIEVLYYGHGDGTWPLGKPGLIFKLELEYPEGRNELILSNDQWKSVIARAWKPGQYKRWYLRAFQEEFDARLYPYGWKNPDYQNSDSWPAAMIIEGASDKPTIAHSYPDYLYEAGSQSDENALLPRSVPFMDERLVYVKQLTESHRVKWIGIPDDYFDFLHPDGYEIIPVSSCESAGNGMWRVHMPEQEAAVLTFEFSEQIVGWPFFTIEAPAGTIIELMVQEGHDPLNLSLMNNHFHSWTRFICREGINYFETFDFESLRWLQMHIRNGSGEILIRDVGVLRRIFPWVNTPLLTSSDPAIQKVFNACINTLHNSAQETIVDGMGRERQQYASDGGIQMISILYAFGDQRLPARYIRTFGKGLTKDGYFMDCWPAYDRLARIMERQLDLTPWGPLLDHGVAFVFENYLYYMMTGEIEPVREVFPNLVRFVQYLYSSKVKDHLLPVEDTGVPTVWLDHQAFHKQRHKRCGYNMYVAGMLEYAFAPLCRLFGEERMAEDALHFSEALLHSLKSSFWSTADQVYINNLPWLDEENEKRMDDRSLAMSVIFGYCPAGAVSKALEVLAASPPGMGFSYPGNAHWRLWALGMSGKEQVVIDEIRNRWALLDSVRLNNTLQEDWHVQPDSHSQWSHNPVAPLLSIYMIIAGIIPLEPGFKKIRIWPKLGDMEKLHLEIPVQGNKISFQATGKKGRRNLKIRLPENMTGELYLNSAENVNLREINEKATPGLRLFFLEGGKDYDLILRKT